MTKDRWLHLIPPLLLHLLTFNNIIYTSWYSNTVSSDKFRSNYAYTIPHISRCSKRRWFIKVHKLCHNYQSFHRSRFFYRVLLQAFVVDERTLSPFLEQFRTFWRSISNLFIRAIYSSRCISLYALSLKHLHDIIRWSVYRFS